MRHAPCTPQSVVFGRGSLTLFRVRGVPVRAHWTLLLLLPYLAVAFATRFTAVAEVSGTDPDAVVLPPLVWGLLIAVGLFASVALHELAHTLLAVRLGGRVREITLMLLGGVSQMEHMPRRPRAEAAVAAVGPATSLALGIVMLLFLMVIPGRGAGADLRIGVFYLGQLNLVLGVFNLLPAFPMDGGRVLRAVLASRLGPTRATWIAARVGQVAAVALALLGLWSGNFLLLLVALFLFTGAGAEARAQEVGETLARLRVADLVTAPPPTVPLDAYLDEVLPRMREASRLDLVAVDSHGEPVGVVSAADLADVPAMRRAVVQVRDLGHRLTRRAVRVAAYEPAREALDRAAAAGAEYLLVVESAPGGRTRLIGLVGAAEIEQALAFLALERPTPRPPRYASLRPRKV